MGALSPEQAGVVAAAWRYPVTSLAGELVAGLDVTAYGVTGDRAWVVVDTRTGQAMSARSTPTLLAVAARWDAGRVTVTLPDGTTAAAGDQALDAALSDWLRLPVRLEPRPPRDADRVRLHVLTTASLRAAHGHHPVGDWDPRRFRPDVVVDVDADGWAEDEWLERRLTLGTTVLAPYKRTVRCPMTTHPQPGLPADPTILVTVDRVHERSLGVYARIVVAGRVAVGDAATVEPASVVAARTG